MQNFSSETYNFLKKAGWHETRNVSISNVKSRVESDGYTCSAFVEQFMREFYELNIQFLNAEGLYDDFHFDAIKALEETYPVWAINNYSVRIGQKFCIIGKAYRGHMNLYMSQNGSVYAAFDDLLYLVGNNGYEAIERICTDQPLIEIQ